MESAIQSSKLVLTEQIDKNEFAKVLIELIKNDWEVQKDILNFACSCPNIVTRI